uniref:Protein kintoun n=1 Tax=Globisporangium ultimum (strain ATCC 200006 / CBS 805.95 / DAOM BR144) TaxID=431595 RepID=K3WS74_GLOUD
MVASPATKNPPQPARSSADNNASSSPKPVPSEAEFARLFDEAMKHTNAHTSSSGDEGGASSPELRMSVDEQKKFLSAMQNPEFRSLLNEYMAEISDPANRAETEQYLSQLERDQKVPEDKLLVRPSPGFVVKAKWQQEPKENEQKLFVNVCSSGKIQPPSSTSVTTGARGTSWHLPYLVGPERLEKDNSGAMVATFDVCFHPTTVGFATTQRPYHDMVVKTCLDAIETLLRESRKKPQAVVNRAYHVLKGVKYKSGDPVTMCLRKPAAEKDDKKALKPQKDTETTTKKSEVVAANDNESKNTSAASGVQEKEKTIDVVIGKRIKDTSPLVKSPMEASAQATPDAEPLLREVSSTKTVASSSKPKQSVTPAAQKIAFQLIYRGKFELLHHMQAEHENIVPVERNRPKELVVEMEFPTHSSAAGMDLDVSECALKLSTKGYEPLEIALPFPVFEAKGSAKFDKKARKLVVTLPVQPPPEPKPKSVSLVVEEEDDEDEAGKGHGSDQTQLKGVNVASQVVSERSTQSVKPPVKAKDEEDKFAMLREIAVMVQHDPHYLPREDKTATTNVQAEDSFDDLPPLESCSEDEEDDKQGEQEDEEDDLVLVEAPALPKVITNNEDVEVVISASTTPAKTPPCTTKETSSCISLIIEVAGIDATSVKLTFPSSRAVHVRFSAATERYELKIDALAHDCDASRAEFDVASENMVVILKKQEINSASSSSATSSTSSLPSIAPAVRFQNQLLYELD